MNPSIVKELRRHEKRLIQDEIKIIEGYLRQSNSTLDRLRSSESENLSFVNAQIQKTAQTICDFYTDIKQLKERERQLDTGIFDSELREQNNFVQKEINTKANDKKKKKDIERENDKKNKINSQAYWDASVKADRKDRYLKKDADYSYDYYLKMSESIPRYIQENLKQLPNNRGYIWKGIYHYGARPPQHGQPIELEEPIRGQEYDIVHMWTEKSQKNKPTLVTYQKFEKPRKGRDSKKTLISTETYETMKWGCRNSVL
jgi:hypothetical protein